MRNTTALALLVAAASAAVAAPPKTVGFIGLGTMGSHIARHLHAESLKANGRPALVWNRRPGVAEEHAAAHGTVACDSAAALAAEADVICLCLSTSAAVEAVLSSIEELRPNALIIDCTSGVPAEAQAIAAALQARGARFVDAPVSGGPAGAEAGSLTSMLGGAEADVAEATPWCRAWSAKVVHCGPVGAGDAVKAVNNVLNAAHIALASEGLAALKSLGVSPSVALEVINSSSGKSLQTERFGDNVLSRKFAYGFALALMTKDVGIAADLVAEHAPAATLIPAVRELYNAGLAELGDDEDYTGIVKRLERQVGVELEG